jgi:hypothetical protein
MRRVERSTVLTLVALALAAALVLTETIALRDAGRRLRAQEAAERAARDSAARAATTPTPPPVDSVTPGGAAPPR